MPDMERLTRSLELHLAPTSEAKAFVQGKHIGLDTARKQVAWTAVIVAVLIVLGTT